MMTLESAIKHCEEVAEEQEKLCKVNDSFNFSQPKWKECAAEHRQLAEWLKELKQLREQEPCEDAISKASVFEIVGNLMSIPYDLDRRITEKDVSESMDEIRTLPPVTPTRKKGHWIDIMVGDMPAQACDQCNTFFPLAYTGGGHKYCPNCGAKMGNEE